MNESVLRSKKSQGDFSVNMALTVLALLIFAMGIFVYFLFFQNPPGLASRQRPEIVIPESGLPAAVSGQALGDEARPVSSKPAVEVLKVIILDTPTGFLNLRSGPGTGFEKIGSVNPGELYELVSENAEQTWYEIRLAGGTGWVIKTYAELE